MASTAQLSKEEIVGLAIAGAAHVALAGVLAIQSLFAPDYQPPQRITVSLASEIGLESTAPSPSVDPAAATAPEISDDPAPEPVPEIELAQPLKRNETPVRPTRRRDRDSLTLPPVTATPREQAGGAVSGDFLEGMSDADGREGQAGERPSPQQQASILGAIVRQLRQHWNPPSGVEADQLTTSLRFQLNRDGSLRGSPQVLRTTGQTSSNRAQVGRHQEMAIRAVRLAAPFNLPERFYAGWRTVELDFNQELAR